MARRRLSQTILVVTRRRRLIESAPRNYPVAISRHPVTHRAINVVAFLSFIEIYTGELHRNRIHVVWIRGRLTVARRRRRRRRRLWRTRRWLGGRLFAEIEGAILTQVTPRDCPLDQRPRSR